MNVTYKKTNYYFILMLLVIVFQIYDFYKTEKYSSKIILDSVNSIINNKFNGIKLTFDFIKAINNKCEDSDCKLGMVGAVLSKSTYFFEEFFFQKKGSDFVYYVNKDERGFYNLSMENNSYVNEMRGLGGYKFSKSYISQTTKKNSFMISTEYQGYILFVEVSFDNLFKGYNDEKRYYVIIDSEYNEFILPSRKNKIKQ